MPESVLQPEHAWKDKDEFGETLEHLGQLFVRNFSSFLGGDK